MKTTIVIMALSQVASLAFFIYINARLLVYIRKLEASNEKVIEKSENLEQSLREIVQEDFLLSDGRLKKFVYQKDGNRIYNGFKVDEQSVEI